VFLDVLEAEYQQAIAADGEDEVGKGSSKNKSKKRTRVGRGSLVGEGISMHAVLQDLLARNLLEQVAIVTATSELEADDVGTVALSSFLACLDPHRNLVLNSDGSARAGCHILGSTFGDDG